MKTFVFSRELSKRVPIIGGLKTLSRVFNQKFFREFEISEFHTHPNHVCVELRDLKNNFEEIKSWICYYDVLSRL